MHILDVNDGNESVQEKIRKYRVSSVPTIVIDSRIKVVGVPSFPWFCGDEFYKFLEKEYPLLIGLDR